MRRPEETLDANASSRELAAATVLARSSVQLAIDSLNRKGILHSDAGAANRPATHRLIFLDAVEIQERGPIFSPEVAQESGQGGLNSRPLPNEESSVCEPAHLENASAPAESIEKNDFDTLIDRIQNAKKSDFNDEVFEQARHLIASHHAKFAREGRQIPGLPDDQITAQFLAVADWPRLCRTLHELLSEHKQSSHCWGWYVTVALQRIHGISPDKVLHCAKSSETPRCTVALRPCPTTHRVRLGFRQVQFLLTDSGAVPTERRDTCPQRTDPDGRGSQIYAVRNSPQQVPVKMRS